MSFDSTPDSLRGVATFYQEHAATIAAHARAVRDATAADGDEDALRGAAASCQRQAAHMTEQAREYRAKADALAIAMGRSEDE